MVRHSPVTGRYVTIEVDGMEYKVFYLHNGKGQPLICQHTAGCHNHQWRGLLEDEEITKNYNVIAYDLHATANPIPPITTNGGQKSTNSPRNTTSISSSHFVTRSSWMTRFLWAQVSAAISRCNWPCANQTGSRLSSRLKLHITHQGFSSIGGGIPMPMRHRYALRVFGI